MLKLISKALPPGLATAVLCVGCFASMQTSAMAQDTPPLVEQEPNCSLDLSNAGKMSDIVSNALNRGLDQSGLAVRAFLKGSENRYATGAELLKAAANEFNITEAVLAAEVENYRHCNCKHAPKTDGEAIAVKVSKFAKDVTTHVVLHELGHALIREFDLPILANEESAADAFATYYLTTYLPDRALEVLTARTTSLMIEAREVPREIWRVHGEHNSDARRAFQIAALAVAVDPNKYSPMAIGIGMSARDLKQARDYGTEIQRSWRRILSPLWMPAGQSSTETRLKHDLGNPFISQLCSDGLAQELMSALTRFDWHSQVTIHLADAEGGAGWSRSRRTITVSSEYVKRFIEQGKAAE